MANIPIVRFVARSKITNQDALAIQRLDPGQIAAGRRDGPANDPASAEGGEAMLKTLTRLHTPELLHVLASMGHGDELVLVDCHFPSVSHARRLVRLDGADLPDVLSACLQLTPLDTFVKEPALRMEVAGAPNEVPEVQKLCQQVIDKCEGRHVPLAGVERHAFYERAKQAFAIVATGEQRTYGCIIIKKGVAASK
jgi:L-fucose mutarotase